MLNRFARPESPHMLHAIAYVHKIKGLLNLGEAFLVKKTPSRYAPVPMHRQTAPIYTDPNSHFDNSSTVSGVI